MVTVEDGERIHVRIIDGNASGRLYWRRQESSSNGWIRKAAFSQAATRRTLGAHSFLHQIPLGFLVPTILRRRLDRFNVTIHEEPRTVALI